jgi:hypothetical protein
MQPPAEPRVESPADPGKSPPFSNRKLFSAAKPVCVAQGAASWNGNGNPGISQVALHGAKLHT